MSTMSPTQKTVKTGAVSDKVLGVKSAKKPVRVKREKIVAKKAARKVAKVVERKLVATRKKPKPKAKKPVVQVRP